MHTKGPWTRQQGIRFKHDNSAPIKSATGMHVATALDFNNFDRDEEVEANAHLIAAAPELLDVLEQVMTCRIQATTKLLHQMKEVLLKAKGLSTD